MEQALDVVLTDGSHRIINEQQICSIQPQTGYVLLRMSNGEELSVLSPTWEEWYNDVLNRKP